MTRVKRKRNKKGHKKLIAYSIQRTEWELHSKIYKKNLWIENANQVMEYSEKRYELMIAIVIGYYYYSEIINK